MRTSIIALATVLCNLQDEGSSGGIAEGTAVDDNGTKVYLTKADVEAIKDLQVYLGAANPQDVIETGLVIAHAQGISLSASLQQGEEEIARVHNDDAPVNEAIPPQLAAIMAAHTDANGDFDPATLSDDESETILFGDSSDLGIDDGDFDGEGDEGETL